MARNRPVFSNRFFKSYGKCDSHIKSLLDKLVQKILSNPELGKPLRYNLAGTRAERLGKFRVIYEQKGDFVIFHEFEHRKKVYK